MTFSLRPHRRSTEPLIDFFVQGDAFLEVFELDGASNFRQDGKGVRIPAGVKRSFGVQVA